MQRKIHIFITETDPEKINKAMAGLFQVWLSVIATLKLKFACVITFGNALGNFFNKTATYLLSDMLFEHIPDEYDKWVPVVLSYICKLFATSIVWWLFQGISGLYTAIGGGLAFSCALLHYIHGRGLDEYNGKHVLGEDFDPDNTYLDEIIGWPVALVGYYIQLRNGFRIPGAWQ